MPDPEQIHSAIFNPEVFFEDAHMIGYGLVGDDNPHEIIDKSKWEEVWPGKFLKWDSDLVPAELIVELPFWLMMEACDLDVPHEESTVKASIRQDYYEVHQHSDFMDSRANLAHIGPRSDLDVADIINPIPWPVIRALKTVVCFPTKVLSDAVQGIFESTTRRLNEADHYLFCFALAHLPYLNKIITAYRSTSYDPYAVEVAEWDVPLWWLKCNGRVIRCQLTGYASLDYFPMIGTFGTTEKNPVFVTTPDDVREQMQAPVAAGKLELLDALSLAHRGRFGESVRSAVTAIEVALETALVSLLKQTGMPEADVQRHLAKTRNAFMDRVEEYERLSGRRLPGPIISFIPWLNGLRLKEELNWIRNLRHQIVHAGVRVDVFAYGPMQRAMEAMTQLFHWLAWEDKYGQKTKNMTWFNTFRPRPRHDVEYKADGPVIIQRIREDSERAEAIVDRQYHAAIGPEEPDIALFSKMSFEMLGLAYRDTPVVQNEINFQERFIITDGGREAFVFCFSVDGPVEPPHIAAVVVRAMSVMQSVQRVLSVLCIANHQKHLRPEMRETERAVSGEAVTRCAECGITIITSHDMRDAAQGVQTLGWNADRARDMLFMRGRVGALPPHYSQVGTYARFYPRLSVMSIDLIPECTISVGDVLGVRLGSGYHEVAVSEMHVEQNACDVATGPCRVGIKVATLKKKDLSEGQAVFKCLPGQQLMCFDV